MQSSLPTTSPQEIRAWADRNHAVPVELLPSRVDGEPSQLQMLLSPHTVRQDLRVITWEEFFLKFEAHGLSFIYDLGTSTRHEILQVDERSPYRALAYKLTDVSN